MKKKKKSGSAKIVQPTPNPPDEVTIRIRPIVTYAIDIHRYAKGGQPGQPGSWASFHRVGECADAASAAQMAARFHEIETAKYKKNGPQIAVEDLSHLVNLEHPPLPGQKKPKPADHKPVTLDKAVAGLRDKFIAQGKASKKKKKLSVGTIDEAEDMLKARSRLRKQIKRNNKVQSK